MRIAICGKGGTGKTTLAALMIRQLLKIHPGEAILAVDADPNSNLGEALGVEAQKSIVAITDEIAKNPQQIPQGTTKERFLEYQLQDALVEAAGFDLLVMGRPEGPGCYCYVNNLLRTMIDKLGRSYAYVVIDNEAGMEHLSRRTTRVMDYLLIVSDYSVVGLRSAKRILNLSRELKLEVKKAGLVINRAPQDIGELQEEIGQLGIPCVGKIPEDEQLIKLSVNNGNLITLSDESKAAKAVQQICKGDFRER